MRHVKFIIKSRNLVLLLVFISVSKLHAQVIPTEGARLNYILTGFAIQPVKGAHHYQFNIATGDYNQQEEFESNVKLTINADNNKMLVRLPSFGINYTWQVSYKINGTLQKSRLYHFSTDMSPFVDTSRYRLNVLTNKYESSELYMFVDYSRVIYDMKGEPIWFLPDIQNCVNSTTIVRDMKLTPFNTITFLTEHGAYEINYDGKVLWQAPEVKAQSGERAYGDYHHEFTRLSNGNYMLMHNELKEYKLPVINDMAIKRIPNVEKRNDGYYVKADLGNILLYDAGKKLLWSWTAADYITSEDLLLSNPADDEGAGISTHMNAFHFDEEKQNLYVGFKDLSRIVKIKYPDGRILAEYGQTRISHVREPFKTQHTMNKNKDGFLYVFNNNFTGKPTDVSSILELREMRNGSLKKVWEYTCNIDTVVASSSGRGGNATEIEHGTYLVCMGAIPRIFIVNRSKNLLFNAIVESKVNEKWMPLAQYRVSPVKHSDYMKMINP